MVIDVWIKCFICTHSTAQAIFTGRSLSILFFAWWSIFEADSFRSLWWDWSNYNFWNISLQCFWTSIGFWAVVSHNDVLLNSKANLGCLGVNDVQELIRFSLFSSLWLTSFVVKMFPLLIPGFDCFVSSCLWVCIRILPDTSMAFSILSYFLFESSSLFAVSTKEKVQNVSSFFGSTDDLISYSLAGKGI